MSDYDDDFESSSATSSAPSKKATTSAPSAVAPPKVAATPISAPPVAAVNPKSKDTPYHIAWWNDKQFERNNQIKGQPLNLEDLKKCKIYVFDAVDSVTMDDCEDCELVVAACSASISIRGSKNITLVAATKQLRFRDSSYCTACVFAMTDPTLEGSHHIQLYPFNARLPQLKMRFQEAKLDASQNRFVHVIDADKDDAKVPMPHFNVNFPNHRLSMIQYGAHLGPVECPDEIAALLDGRLQPAPSSLDAGTGSKPPAQPTITQPSVATTPTPVQAPAVAVVASQPATTAVNPKSKDTPYHIAWWNDKQFERNNQIKGQPLNLEDLKKCKIYVFDAVDSVTMDDCEDCELVVAACSASISIRGSKNITLVAATKQLRFRDSSYCTACVFAMTDPTLEGSHHIQLYPFNARLPQLKMRFQEAKLDASQNRFVHVIDADKDDAKVPMPHFNVNFPNHRLSMIQYGAHLGPVECPDEIAALLEGRLQPAPSSLDAIKGQTTPSSVPPTPATAVQVPQPQPSQPATSGQTATDEEAAKMRAGAAAWGAPAPAPTPMQPAPATSQPQPKDDALTPEQIAAMRAGANAWNQPPPTPQPVLQPTVQPQQAEKASEDTAAAMRAGAAAWGTPPAQQTSVTQAEKATPEEAAAMKAGAAAWNAAATPAATDSADKATPEEAAAMKAGAAAWNASASPETEKATAEEAAAMKAGAAAWNAGATQPAPAGMLATIPAKTKQEPKVTPKKPSTKFAGVSLTLMTERVHVDPHDERIAKLRKKLEDKQKAVVEHAREQLLRRELHISEEKEKARKVQEEKDKENAKKAEGALVKVEKTREVIVPCPPVELLYPQLDKDRPQEPTSNFCGIVFYNDHVFVDDAIKKAVGKGKGTTAFHVVNVWGFVPYRGRFYGLKKHREGYHLGLGSKGTPLHFAVLAGRLDVVVLLLQNGAKYKHTKEVLSGTPSVRDLANANGNKAVIDVIEAFQKEEEEKEKKEKNKILGAQIRYERDCRRRSKSRERAESTANAAVAVLHPPADP